MRLILGYIAIFGIYFLVKGVMFMPLKVVPGVVQEIATKEEVLNTPKGQVSTTITYPIITFREGAQAGSTGAQHTLEQEEVMSFSNYVKGTPVQVAYEPGNTAKAKIYSVAEYWFPVSIMLMLAFVCLGWTAAFVFVGRFLKQGR